MNNNSNNIYIKVDNNKVINEKCIKWIKKMDECLSSICNKIDEYYMKDTHTVCKINNSDSYNKHFE